MDEPFPPEPPNLRLLRILVTVLMATMIVGIIVIVGLLFTRFWGQTPAQSAPVLPQQINLPNGVSARAVTFGADWYAVVTDADTILIFSTDGELRQSVEITVP